MVKISRALISVSDKRGLAEFARGLEKLGVEIVSTGGTAKTLRETGVKVQEVSDVTKFPEMLDGRVKTLHPVIAGGILAVRSKAEHVKQMEKHGIPPIDLVVVNLYPFAETIAKPGVSQDEAIENIDIGGPTLIRAAAKNHDSVAVVVEPERYDEILAEMRENDGALTDETRYDLARAAFKYTADYDETIYLYFEKASEFPDLLKLVFSKISDLRYGENPHQQAAYYCEEGAHAHCLVRAQQLHGKELSFNNILDLDAAWSLANEFTVPCAVIIKHNNPCGVALADNVSVAYERAHAADPVSAFGGVVAINRVVDEETAAKIAEIFIEALIAPAFVEEALEILTKKKGIRLMFAGEERSSTPYGKDLRRVEGGLLVQDYDVIHEDRKDMTIAGSIKPNEKQWEDLLFAWRVAKHVKSNAIVFAKGLVTTGIGAGQMSRVDSTFMAIRKGGDRVKGSVMASDAFFPFADSLELAAEAGITAVIQPGGSVSDQEVIEAANSHKIAMVFTGKRHFRH